MVGMHLNKAPSGEDWKRLHDLLWPDVRGLVEIGVEHTVPMTQLDGTDGDVRLGNKGGGESSEIRYTAWYGCSRTG